MSDGVQHILIGTKGDISLCSLTLQYLVEGLIVRHTDTVSCPQCQAVLYAMRRLYTPPREAVQGVQSA